jgi:hypothetical protein
VKTPDLTISTASLLANDSDPDRDPLSILWIGNPLQGGIGSTI